METPLRLGELRVSSIMVRTSDWRGDHNLPWAPLPGQEDRIVVTGKLPSQHALYRMTVGLDVLNACSEATYTRRTGSLVFRCTDG